MSKALRRIFKESSWNIPYLTNDELEDLKKQINKELWKRK